MIINNARTTVLPRLLGIDPVAITLRSKEPSDSVTYSIECKNIIAPGSTITAVAVSGSSNEVTVGQASLSGSVFQFEVSGGLLNSAYLLPAKITDSDGNIFTVNLNIQILPTGIISSNPPLALGPQGPVGPVGPEGIQGPIGPQGIAGPVGPQGVRGFTGPTGAQGTQGEVGPQGPQGVQGPQGLTGAAGIDAYEVALSDGFKGSQTDWLNSLVGPQGPKGDKGDTGSVGPIGPKGDTGPQGDKGDTGPQGVQGAKGDKGDTGLTGATGPQGEVGPQGETGATGPQGPKGDIGLTGPVGPTGPEGPTGAQGAAGQGLTNRGDWVSGATYNRDDYVFAQTSNGDGGRSLYVATTQTSFDSTVTPANDLANWSEVYAPQGPIGPQGPQGEVGPQGNTGPQGIQGVKGDQGVAGPAGSTGPAGVDGKDGAKGDKGDTGPQGPKGDTGSVGPAGATGPAGPKGDSGKTAYQSAVDEGFSGTEQAWLASLVGPQGPKGDTGSVGPIGDTGPAGEQGPQGPQGPAGVAGATYSGDVSNATATYTDSAGKSQTDTLSDTLSGISSDFAAASASVAAGYVPKNIDSTNLPVLTPSKANIISDLLTISDGYGDIVNLGMASLNGKNMLNINSPKGHSVGLRLTDFTGADNSLTIQKNADNTSSMASTWWGADSGGQEGGFRWVQTQSNNLYWKMSSAANSSANQPLQIFNGSGSTWNATPAVSIGTDNTTTFGSGITASAFTAGGSTLFDGGLQYEPADGKSSITLVPSILSLQSTGGQAQLQPTCVTGTNWSVYNYGVSGTDSNGSAWSFGPTNISTPSFQQSGPTMALKYVQSSGTTNILSVNPGEMQYNGTGSSSVFSVDSTGYVKASGAVHADHILLAAADYNQSTTTVGGQGVYTGWNVNSGDGATYMVNINPGVAGGFKFYDIPTSQKISDHSPIVSFDANGSAVFNGQVQANGLVSTRALDKADNSTNVATTAWVQSQGYGTGSGGSSTSYPGQAYALYEYNTIKKPETPAYGYASQLCTQVGPGLDSITISTSSFMLAAYTSYEIEVYFASYGTQSDTYQSPPACSVSFGSDVHSTTVSSLTYGATSYSAWGPYVPASFAGKYIASAGSSNNTVIISLGSIPAQKQKTLLTVKFTPIGGNPSTGVVA
ncbi:collagen-like protein [Gluconobacter sp. LMG 1744]|uniref:collagen-like protein n=1 Tax=Gluconobacter cadivus TaxID=2728101 RepID=UPI0018856959|nr:collagen-like protein [Gluconobacter cadivus]MBF0892754.1 collagen-like protein [Gluconobacter cadivus]